MRLSTAEMQDIYYYLSTHHVERIKTLFEGTTYYFGDYKMHVSDSFITVFKNGSLIESCDRTSKNNPVIEIYEAVHNKCEGRYFVNPYEKMSTDLAVKKSAHKFEEILVQNAKKIFPYDYRKDKAKYQQIIAEMKILFADKIRQKIN